MAADPGFVTDADHFMQPNDRYESGHQIVVDGLKDIYARCMAPIEEATKFDIFHSTKITDAEFDAAPIVMLVGPYSVGKTSFIR